MSTLNAMTKRTSVSKRERVRQRRIEAHVALLQPRERSRRRQRGHADERFAHAEPHQRAPHAIPESTRDETAERESGHEAGPHRARRVRRDAEDQSHQAQPQHLIDERADARTEEQDQKCGQQPRVARRGCGRGVDRNGVDEHSRRRVSVRSKSSRRSRIAQSKSGKSQPARRLVCLEVWAPSARVAESSRPCVSGRFSGLVSSERSKCR